MPKTDIEVELLGHDGNAVAIMMKVKRALTRAGHRELAEEYMKEATSGNYDHLLMVTQEYVEVA